MRCGKCGSDNPYGKKFCSDCGAQLANRCPKCGVENPEGKRFCGDCGTSLSPDGGATSSTQMRMTGADAPRLALTAEEDARETPEGERKTVTALFADIKGSMELMEDLDPEEARAIVDPALKLMTDAVRSTSPACSSGRARPTRRVRCWPRSTTGSPKASTPPI